MNNEGTRCRVASMHQTKAHRIHSAHMSCMKRMQGSHQAASSAGAATVAASNQMAAFAGNACNSCPSLRQTAPSIAISLTPVHCRHQCTIARARGASRTRQVQRTCTLQGSHTSGLLAAILELRSPTTRPAGSAPDQLTSCTAAMLGILSRSFCVTATRTVMTCIGSQGTHSR
jgi:hypothetical protein